MRAFTILVYYTIILQGCGVYMQFVFKLGIKALSRYIIKQFIICSM